MSTPEDYELHPLTFQLSEIFPEVPLMKVSESLKLHNGNLEVCSEELLSLQVLEQENFELSESLIDDLRDSETFHVVTSRSRSYGSDKKKESQKSMKPLLNSKALQKEKQMLKAMSDLLDKTDIMCSLLHISEKDQNEVQDFIRENNMSILKAVLQFFKKHRDYHVLEPTDSLSSSTPVPPVESPIVVKGRVQGSYASKKLNSQPMSNSSSSASAQKSGSETSINQLNSKISYLAITEKAVSHTKHYTGTQLLVLKELDDLKIENKSLCLFPDLFYQDALDFFQYNLDDVLSLTFKLLENKQEVIKEFHSDPKFIFSSRGTQETSDSASVASNPNNGFVQVRRPSSSSRVNSKTREELIDEANRLKTEALNAKDKGTKGYYLKRASELRSLAKEKLDEHQDNLIDNQLQSKHRLDLHGLSVSKALEAVAVALNQWWNEELHLRESHGTNNSNVYSPKAGHLPCYVVITGRGLHSSGTGKIKNSVSRYLSDNRYLFDENMGSFIVQGKRK